jgi:hypothetical protein
MLWSWPRQGKWFENECRQFSGADSFKTGKFDANLADTAVLRRKKNFFPHFSKNFPKKMHFFFKISDRFKSSVFFPLYGT